jgi:hypothetical protein
MIFAVGVEEFRGDSIFEFFMKGHHVISLALVSLRS